jgi:hypothetical protein
MNRNIWRIFFIFYQIPSIENLQKQFILELFIFNISFCLHIDSKKKGCINLFLLSQNAILKNLSAKLSDFLELQ